MTQFSLLQKADLQKYLNRSLYLLAASALALNIAACWSAYRHEPLRDAASRSLMAAESSWFFASGLAEPLPVFALKAAMAAGADPDTAVRVQGLALFALLALLTFLALRRGFGVTAAVMAALFVGANPYFGYHAVLGSSHLFALVFLVLFAGNFHGEARGDALRAGLWGGLACLSRLDSAWFLLLLAGFSLLLRRRAFRFREAGLALGLAALLVSPYLAWQRAHFGGAFYAQELSLRRWANLAEHGYSAAAPAAQGPLSPAAFVFRGGPGAAASSALKGLGQALGSDLPRALYHKFLFVFVFLGAYACFAFRKYGLLFFLGAALLPVLPLAAIAQVPATGGPELRYYLAALWALCALAGHGFGAVLEWFEATAAQWIAKKAPAAPKGKVR